ncbi:MAG: MCP four helix bundle domain-containing protein [Bacteroidales bacterium]|nr:MCP four helix bundle domain-containing protein [Bacteroidales bacterium]
MFNNFVYKVKHFHLTMRMKLTLGFCAVAVALLVSSIISILEFSRMSNYVSDLIAGNIRSINDAQKMAEQSNAYNLSILAVIGDDGQKKSHVPTFNQDDFLLRCDSLKASMSDARALPLADSILYSYSAYMLTSLELPAVLEDEFTDSRDWYFLRLQPKFQRLKSDIDKLSSVFYTELQRNSETFQRGFYRSVIPGVVAVGVGLLLLLLLLFFILAYYVNPIYRMLHGLNDYRSIGRKYSNTFDGDDQLQDLNGGITEITEENLQLRKRLKILREKSGTTE